GLKAHVFGGMPIAGREDRYLGGLGCRDPVVDLRDDRVAALDRQRAARTEISLHVDDHESVATAQSTCGIAHQSSSLSAHGVRFNSHQRPVYHVTTRYMIAHRCRRAPFGCAFE